MWKIVIKQEYEYSYMDNTTSTGVNESTYEFADFVKAMNFVECAIDTGTSKTYAQIEFVEKEGEQDEI
jgi:hypothetical protein